MEKIIIVAVLLFLSLPVHAAEIYKYIDENETVVFTNDYSRVPEGQRQNTEQYRYQNSEKNKRIEEKEADKLFIEMLKKEFDAKESCPSETRTEVEEIIKSTWEKMTQALISGDLDTALSHFSVFSRDEYRKRFSGMGRDKIKSIYGSGKIKAVTLNTLYDDGIAECGIIRKESAGEYSYPLNFVRDLDCTWRIQGL